MANEKNRPPQHPGQNDPPPTEPSPSTRRQDTDASGDPLDGTGEDNHTQADDGRKKG